MKIQSFDQSLEKYSGRNNFSESTNLDSTQFRSISNWDIFSGVEQDYLRTRRGSRRLVPDSPTVQLGQILNKVVFPVNGDEYLICAYSSGPDDPNIFFSSQKLLTIENPIPIKSATWIFDASDFMSNLVLFGVTPANSNNLKLYFSWDGTTLSIYSDASMTTRVAVCVSPSADLTNLIVEDSGSGISGTFYAGTLGSPATGDIEYDTFSVIASNGIPDMKIFNNRVFIFQQGGNKIVEWDSVQEIFKIRQMGLYAPVIESSGSDNDVGPGTGTIDPQGAYYYGVEFVIRSNNADLVASTPNRKYSDGSIPQVLPIAGNGELNLLETSLRVVQNWTDLRVWRSKNVIPNFSDPLFPIDAQGVIDQLYELALISRAEVFGAFAPIATSSTLPAGNAFVQAGLKSGIYEITDQNGDSVLTNLIDLDLIELIPLPGCRTGDINKGAVFSAGIGSGFVAPNPPMIDPSIVEDVLYTTTPYSQYQEQWDPQAFINAGRDGKKTTGLLTYIQDLIVFREGMTKRIQAGNPDAGITMLDDKIGITTFRMIGYIPGIGICAICSDKYFRYLTFGLSWSQNIESVEISQSIYDVTSVDFITGIADFAYINGKLLMLLPSTLIYALHVKEGKGWTEYSYPKLSEVLFSFSNAQRIGTAAGNQYLMEIEYSNIVDEDSSDLEEEDHQIVAPFEGYAFSGKGQLLEPTRYSFWGKLTSTTSVTAKVSNQNWVMQPTFQDPGLYSATTDLNEREYRFEPQPQDVGVFKWLPLRGQFVSFSVSTIAPAMISWQKVIGRIRQTLGNQQSSLAGGIVPQGPGWANPSLMILNFEDPGDVFFDASGKGINFNWVPNAGSKTNRVNQKPGKGVLITAPGYLNYPTDFVLPLTGISNLVWKVVFSLTSGGNFTANGKSGSSFWWMQITDSTAVFMLDNGVTYTWTATVSLNIGEVYALTFLLKKDYSAKFYIESLLSSIFSGVTTVRTDGATPPASATQIVGAYSPHLSNLVLTGWDNSTLYGTYYSGAGHTWYLWNSAAERDAANPDTAVAYVPMLNEAATLTILPLNASGLGGTVDNDGNNAGMDGNLDVVYANSLVDGENIQPVGIVSYYEIQKSDQTVEQAKRFWGIMKVYP